MQPKMNKCPYSFFIDHLIDQLFILFFNFLYDLIDLNTSFDQISIHKKYIVSPSKILASNRLGLTNKTLIFLGPPVRESSPVQL
jgi:hypothetical protein